jgi:hypothetical protein
LPLAIERDDVLVIFERAFRSEAADDSKNLHSDFCRIPVLSYQRPNREWTRMHKGILFDLLA